MISRQNVLTMLRPIRFLLDDISVALVGSRIIVDFVMCHIWFHSLWIQERGFLYFTTYCYSAHHTCYFDFRQGRDLKNIFTIIIPINRIESVTDVFNEEDCIWQLHARAQRRTNLLYKVHFYLIIQKWMAEKCFKCCSDPSCLKIL